MGKESYEIINYKLRFGKNIERKMIIDVLKRLYFFEKLENYSYIGLGSPFFEDFSLIHRILGINDMQSIEKADKNKLKRFEFNKPYSCIKMNYGCTNEILPSLNLSKRNICWLDFDDPLNINMLTDIKTYINRCTSGSVFLISVNIENFDRNLSRILNKEEENKIIERFKELFFEKQVISDEDGTESEEIISKNNHITKDVKKIDLIGQGFLEFNIKTITNCIQESINNRKLLNPINFEQIFNFAYNDGAKMLTLGYVFYSDEEKEEFLKCDFKDFHFCRFDNNTYDIKVPSLTYKEINYLNSKLPHHRSEIDNKIVPISDINKYEKIYRYFPTFLESFH